VHRVLDLVLDVVHGLFELVVLVEVHRPESDGGPVFCPGQVSVIIAGQVAAVIIARPFMTRQLVLHLGVSDTCMRVVSMRQCLVRRQRALDLSNLSN
jgi:hypothetical protein